MFDLATLVSSYRRTFGTSDGERVLEELREYCFADSSAMEAEPGKLTTDPNVLLIAEGRRQVWLLIQNRMKQDAGTPPGAPIVVGGE